MEGLDRLFSGLRLSSTGMSAERTRIDTIAENIAHADVTKMPDGSGPYRRKVARFDALLEGGGSANSATPSSGVRAKVETDTVTPFEVVHDPGHPDADAEGNVLFPNVNATQEMAEMILAMRSYEANLNAQDTFVKMAERALKIAQ